MTNVRERNVVIVLMKGTTIQISFTIYAKYVYYNCIRVLCECHGYKCVREPSRIPVTMLKRLSQKSEKTAVLCMELFKKKRAKVIESPSSY